MKSIGLDRKSRDYLYSLNIDSYDEGQFIRVESVLKANISFKAKLENFKKFIGCLSGDRCFALWIRATEDLLIQSEQTLLEYADNGLSETKFKEIHAELAPHMKELADRVYEGHWEYGVSQEVDQQFDDLTELCRRIWDKESKAWVGLAKVWQRLELSDVIN